MSHNIHNFTELLYHYQDSLTCITSKYLQSSDESGMEAIKSLNNNFSKYLQNKQKKQLKSNNLNQMTHQTKDDSIIEQLEDLDIDKNYHSCNYPGKIKAKNNHTQNYYHKNYNPSQDSILQQLQRQSHEDSILIDDSQNAFANYQQKSEFHRKTIAQILQQSQKKVNENKNYQLSQQQKDFMFQNQSEDTSQYSMSDYSSNQSSNQSDKEEHYVSQLFNGMFNHKKHSYQSNNTTQATENTDENDKQNKCNALNTLKPQKKVLKFNLNFNAKKLLDSPKKQKINKQTRKRLYLGPKKVPRWAQDFDKVKTMNLNNRNKAQDIFGNCIVENLNTNVIFERCEKICRTSSAKWSKQFFMK